MEKSIIEKLVDSFKLDDTNKILAYLYMLNEDKTKNQQKPDKQKKNKKKGEK